MCSQRQGTGVDCHFPVFIGCGNELFSVLICRCYRSITIINLCSCYCRCICIRCMYSGSVQCQDDAVSPCHFPGFRCQPCLFHTTPSGVVEQVDLIICIRKRICRITALDTVDLAYPSCFLSIAFGNGIVYKNEFATVTLEVRSACFRCIQKCMQDSITSVVVLNITVCRQILCRLLDLNIPCRAEYGTLTCKLYRYRSTLLRYRIQIRNADHLVCLFVSHFKVVCFGQVAGLRYMVGIRSIFQCVGSILVRLHDFASLHNQYGCAVRDLEGGLFDCSTTGDVDGVGTGFSIGSVACNSQFVHTNFQRDFIPFSICGIANRNRVVFQIVYVGCNFSFYIYQNLIGSIWHRCIKVFFCSNKSITKILCNRITIRCFVFNIICLQNSVPSSEFFASVSCRKCDIFRNKESRQFFLITIIQICSICHRTSFSRYNNSFYLNIF